MSRISGIIGFQTKKSNLEHDLCKENRKIPHTLFLGLLSKEVNIQQRERAGASAINSIPLSSRAKNLSTF